MQRLGVVAAMRDEECRAWLALSRLPGISGGRCRQLVEACGTAEAALRASPTSWAGIIGKGAAGAARSAAPDLAWAEQEHGRLQALGGRLLVAADTDYPVMLKEIASPPPLIYALGPADLRAPAVAVVGTRNASDHGRNVAGRIARGLAVRGLNVISGMARGIDTAAHQGALRMAALPGVVGRTVAVLGCGADIVYPLEHRELHEKLRERGGIVSEFPLGDGPRRGWVPRRNRLISGLSMGVILVETPVRSGALITARYAREQNREVFAVPGDVCSGRSAGCHALIRDGAILVEQVDQVIEELGHWLQGPPVASAPLATVAPPTASEPVEEESSACGLIATTSGVQGAVLNRLDAQPCSFDGLSKGLGLAAPEVLAALTELELAGRIRRLPGMQFSRIG